MLSLSKKEKDETLAPWLYTSRRTILKYKKSLVQLGYLEIDNSTKIQKLTVRFFPAPQSIVKP